MLNNDVLGVAWYTPEQYERLKSVADDRAQLHDSYFDWALEAQDAARRVGATHKVFLDVDQLCAWCAARGKALDATSRSQYATELLQQGRGVPL